MDKALIIGVTKRKTEAFENSLEELEGLLQTLNIETKHIITQIRDGFDPRFLIGAGKVNEIKMLIEQEDIDIIVFDNTLSPNQLINLTEMLGIQVYDRAFIILSIFSKNAKTKEAMLEVELAQKIYMRPRLIGMSSSLSRQGGGSYNSKGPGETKLELDRRKLDKEIVALRESIEQIKIQKQVTRQRRIKNSIPVVALVGYTNAGKSSLMNSIMKKTSQNNVDIVEAKDMLFTTLDTKSKLITYKNHKPFILIDTVGFISNMPKSLYESFYTTLLDIKQADIILYVESPVIKNRKQYEESMKILKEIGVTEPNIMKVMTHSDLNIESDINCFSVSNVTLSGIDELLEAIVFSI